nr:MAG TPA: hypothetical protein [Caudoviricetes sp.]
MWGNSHIFFSTILTLFFFFVYILYTKTKAIQWGEAII